MMRQSGCDRRAVEHPDADSGREARVAYNERESAGIRGWPSFFRYLMESGWLVCITAVPVFFNPLSASQFEGDKALIIRAAALLAGGAWLAGRLVSRGGSANPPATPRPDPVTTWLNLAVMALLGSTILAACLSIAPSDSLWGSSGRCGGLFTLAAQIILFFLVSRNAGRLRTFTRLLDMMALVSVPVAVYGICQRAGWDPMPWWRDYGGRVFSTMGNPIFLSAWLMMLIPLTLGRIAAGEEEAESCGTQNPRSRLRRIFWPAVLAIQTAGFLAGFSRGPILGLLTGILAFGVFMLVRRRPPRAGSDVRTGRAWRWRHLTGPAVRSSLLTAAGLLAGVLLYMISSGREPRQDFSRAAALQSPARQLAGGTGQVRALIWEGIFRLLLSPPEPAPDGPAPPPRQWWRPLTGYGPDTLESAFPPVYPPSLIMEPEYESVDRAHNATLDAAAGGGAIGLLTCLAMYGATLLLLYGIPGLPSSARHRTKLALLLFLGGCAGAGLAAWIAGRPAVAAGGFVPGMIAVLLPAVLLRRKQSEEYPAGQWYRPGEFPLYAGVSAALAAHLVEIQFSLITASTGLYAWMFIGLLAARRRPDPPETEERTGGGPEPALPGQEALTAGICVAVVLISLGFTMGIAIPPSAKAGLLAGLLGTATLVAGGTLVMLSPPARPVTPPAGGRKTWPFFLIPAIFYSMAMLALILASAGWPAIPVPAAVPVSLPGPRSGTGLMYFVAIGAAAVLLAELQRKRDGTGLRKPGGRLLPAMIMIGLGVAAGTWMLCLRPLTAGIIHQEANTLARQGRYGPAAAMDFIARTIFPWEDQFPLHQALMEQRAAASPEWTPARRQALLHGSLQTALTAWRLKPYQTDGPLLAGTACLELAAGGETEALFRARDFGRQCIGLDPVNPAGYQLLARAALRLGKPDEARQVAIGGQPGDVFGAWLRPLKAVAEIRLGNLPAALADLQFLARRHPASLARMPAGEQWQLFQEHRLLEPLLVLLRECAAEHPERSGPRLALGRILLQLGRADEAAGHYLTAIRLGAGEPEDLRAGATALLAAGRGAEARHLLERLNVLPRK